MTALILIAALCAALALTTQAAPVQPKGEVVLKPFDLQGVTLGGTLRRQVEEVSEYYLRLVNDDLLMPYRLRAGLPAPGAGMGGVYVGHNPFPQYLSGLARLYAVTGDERCRTKALILLEGWAECLEPDGFFFSDRNPGLLHYYYDKHVAALVDIYLYCHEPKALEYLSRITDCAEKELSRVKLYASPTGFDGGEWYTLAENLYRAYLATGDTRYRDFAKVWEYRDYWNCFESDPGKVLFEVLAEKHGWYHAYSHVNTFSSLAAAYLTEGNPADLALLEKACDYVRATQCYSTGGYGPNENLLQHPTLMQLLAETHRHFETQCGSWAGFKLSRYLMAFTGEARFGDWIELLLINGIGASIPMSGDGRVFYYSDYNPGGAAKHNIDAPWACCTGTRPQAVAEYANLIYFHTENALFVNLYAESTLHWERPGGAVEVAQKTVFPEIEQTVLTLALDTPAEFAINFRLPGWLAGPVQLTVNGEQCSPEFTEDGWARVERTWQSGDVLSLKLPMKLWVSYYDTPNTYPAALMYGPVALAVRGQEGNPASLIPLDNLEGALEPSPGEPLTWRVIANPSVLVRPFYAFKEGERYFLYLDPAVIAAWASYRSARFTGEWKDYGDWMACFVPGSYAEYDFKGTGLRLHYTLFDDCGQVEVSVDGQVVATFDEYGPVRGEKAYFDLTGLSDEAHTLRLTVTGKKADASKGNYANIGAFERLDPPS